MMTKEESIAKVKQILSQFQGWTESYWTPFHEEIHGKVFVHVGEDIIANWYLGCLFSRSILTLEDLQREVIPLGELFPGTPSVVRFFSKNYNIEEDKKIQVELQYDGNRSKKASWTFCRSELTMKKIESSVRDCFDIPVAALELFILGSDKNDTGTLLKEESQLLQVTGNDPISILVRNVQIQFSKVKTVQDALKMCGKGTEMQREARDLLIADDDDDDKEEESEEERKEEKDSPGIITEDHEEVKHAITTIKKLSDVLPLTMACEVTKRAYIDPILVAAARLAGDVTMAVEHNVEGARANGNVDYVFMYKDTFICVTEGKYSDLDHGLFQNIAQLAAVRDTASRKRKHHQIDNNNNDSIGPKNSNGNGGSNFYGVATTYEGWHLVELQNKKVKVSPRVTIGRRTSVNEKDVCYVIALVAEVLKRGKEEHSTTDAVK